MKRSVTWGPINFIIISLCFEKSFGNLHERIVLSRSANLAQTIAFFYPMTSVFEIVIKLLGEDGD